ncbi:hypothetical protein QMZ25_10600 [Stenotrophomonas sp. RS-48]|uniref:hypothetical protein n=1 Tax=Stenotrophomonas sp. RS-48 TaxID=3043300 RepID=UPI0024B53D1C|nr:hypothetical protein [Stenotrophomonas sp. RS-48]MDI9249037.1 hypothetical protein [Stenotrophomonas sp. RS-48]
MNTTMADGAEQRLDAQIAEALFGQPGMSKMDVANRVRELRGDGPALLVPREAGQAERARFEAWAHAQSYRGGNIMADRDSVHRDVYADPVAQLTWKSWQAALSAQPSPSSIFDLEGMLAACVPGGDIADPQVIADNIRRWFAAQPSPGGWGEVTDEMVKAALGPTGWSTYNEEWSGRDRMRAALQAALAARQPVALIAQKVGDYRVTVAEDAITVSHGRDIVFAYSAGDADPINARQPVGEPVAWLVHWSDMPLESLEVTRSASRISEVSALTNPPRIVPLYAAPPAEPVDLGAVCQLAKKWMRIGGEDARFCAGELLTLIDGKAVGK